MGRCVMTTCALCSRIARTTYHQAKATRDLGFNPWFWLFAAVTWWIALLPRTLLIAVVAASYLVGTGVVLLLILKRGAPVALWGGRIALASGVVFLLFGLNLAVREFELGIAQEAVVLQARVDVMSAPLDDETLTISGSVGAPSWVTATSGSLLIDPPSATPGTTFSWTTSWPIRASRSKRRKKRGSTAKWG